MTVLQESDLKIHPLEHFEHLFKYINIRNGGRQRSIYCRMHRKMSSIFNLKYPTLYLENEINSNIFSDLYTFHVFFSCEIFYI